MSNNALNPGFFVPGTYSPDPGAVQSVLGPESLPLLMGLSPAFAAEGVQGGLTLFRGVASDSPAFENALNGIANPIGGNASMLEHSLGNTASNFTSWTSDYDVALQYATNRGATSGVILTNTFGPGAVLQALPSVEAIMGESEFLVPGPVSGAIATGVP